jgi:2-dehydropantoate 2-reductase
LRYVIYGAGAIGGTIGARLFQAGHKVVLIARGAHLEAIRERGLTFETPGESVTLPIPAVGQPSEIEWRQDDAVILGMKTQHTEAALDALLVAAGPDVAVVCAQNGVENERLALRRFANVYAMMVWLPATHLEPGVVIAHAAPINGVLDAGRYPSGADATIGQISSEIDGAGIASKAIADPMRWKYAKLLGNLGNAVQAACRPEDDARPLYGRLREEAIACYRAAGIEWASDEEQAERRKAMSRPAPQGGGRVRGGGSSWQSLARGAGSIETDFLNGEIVLLGRMHGIATPVNAALQRIANKLARDGVAPGSMAITDIEREINET